MRSLIDGFLEHTLHWMRFAGWSCTAQARGSSLFAKLNGKRLPRSSTANRARFLAAPEGTAALETTGWTMGKTLAARKESGR
jgi:hypothetical protein